KQFFEADFDRQCRCCEEEVIRVSLKNLMSFPFIKEAVDAGSLTVGGWHFDITKGEINSLDEKTDQFVSILGS
ncbi:MAG: carbonic anhydrase, partial [Gammaproteobacteria bacterium]